MTIKKKTTKKKATRKKATPKQQLDNSPVSIIELKLWLKGAIEFQPKSWIPDKEQWAVIQNKIYNLTETESLAPVRPERPVAEYAEYAERQNEVVVQSPTQTTQTTQTALMANPPPVQQQPAQHIPQAVGKTVNMPIEKNDGSLQSSFE